MTGTIGLRVPSRFACQIASSSLELQIPMTVAEVLSASLAKGEKPSAEAYGQVTGPSRSLVAKLRELLGRIGE